MVYSGPLGGPSQGSSVATDLFCPSQVTIVVGTVTGSKAQGPEDGWHGSVGPETAVASVRTLSSFTPNTRANTVSCVRVPRTRTPCAPVGIVPVLLTSMDGSNGTPSQVVYSASSTSISPAAAA